MACLGDVSSGFGCLRGDVPLHSLYRQAMTLETNDPRSPPAAYQHDFLSNRTRLTLGYVFLVSEAEHKIMHESGDIVKVVFSVRGRRGRIHVSR